MNREEQQERVHEVCIEVLEKKLSDNIYIIDDITNGFDSSEEMIATLHVGEWKELEEDDIKMWIDKALEKEGLKGFQVVRVSKDDRIDKGKQRFVRKYGQQTKRDPKLRIVELSNWDIEYANEQHEKLEIGEIEYMESNELYCGDFDMYECITFSIKLCDKVGL